MIDILKDLEDFCYIPVVLIPVEHLYPMVKPRASEEVIRLIDRDGLKQPLVVLNTTKEEWERESKGNPLILPPPPTDGVIHQIRGGNNRYQWLIKNNIKEAPCNVFYNRNEAADEMRRQERWHNKKYGRLT